ncbi:DNA-processing protein DprA [Micromonospora sicca]|uniref:DNA-processing protein DprA n=1 Tax=Micromonospora sicca TaxID=2202420 RepID=A0A317DCG7_9ACTN|nr:DNA-processing protein DprA [Micromonospora sp. 4G51]PWR12479.1 DNA-processing protein DprA [Micromonospora sp. 4G51]
MSDSAAEQAAVLALTKASPGEWYRTAAVISEAGSALKLLAGDAGFLSAPHQRYAEELLRRVAPEDVQAASDLIESVATQGIKLYTVLDAGYPANLQMIYNRPPFIWVRGELQPEDFRAIAVVGTRQATDEGLRRATRLARDLASEGVTVLSGLAKGIDTAAHTAALEVGGGRTVAVVGHGILTPIYPKENRGLAERVRERGAIVSQFWPASPPRQMNFPMRNVVMSGMAMGTVVVEASATSGAKMQARLALEHGKRLFLLESLVESQEWARKYAQRPGVSIVRDLDDVLAVLVKLVSVPEQLMLL